MGLINEFTFSIDSRRQSELTKWKNDYSQLKHIEKRLKAIQKKSTNLGINLKEPKQKLKEVQTKILVTKNKRLKSIL